MDQCLEEGTKPGDSVVGGEAGGLSDNGSDTVRV